nr:hybrid signal transduction histidine kinase M [Tanacetum cinerariifolium]
MWILRSLCDYIQEQVATTSGNAKSLWDHLKNLFHDNKDARAINLDNELRFIKIGKMTVNEYYTKIQAMANRLKNLDCEVSEKNMVIFAVNGLDSRFATLAEIIRHREPLLTFETIRNMLLLKESSFNDDSTSIAFESSSASPTILMASSSSNTKLTKSSNLPVAFVSTSSSTWPQHLGHPRGEVLCSLTSCRFISCNKEKSLYVCHACQLGKHVKLPLHSSDSIVTKCFYIIHFDLWTSLIARLVANDSNQQHGVDFDETFSSVVKPATIRTILSLAVSRQWPIHQLDVKNAFLNSDLSETLYMYQPPGFVDSRYPNHALSLGLVSLLVASSPVLLQQIIDSLHKEFDMTDLGGLNYILGISAVLSSYRVIFVSKEGTLELGLHLYSFTTTSLVGYTNADWAGCPSTHRSTSGYCVFLGDNLLLWSAKRQHTISRSSAEAEYRGVANIVAETVWLCNLLCELHSLLLNATLVYCDNAGHVRVLHVSSCFRYADIFTNGLPSALFEDFHSSLSVRPPPAQTTGAY